MAGVKFDLITVGGGLGGSALALVMARQGANVLVLERATEFKDRVRGEAMVPWGAAQAKQLGLYDLLLESCGYELPWLEIYLGETRILRRNTVETTAHQSPFFACYHPAMQEVLLSAAQRNGAEVRRGVRVTGIEPGAPPAVVVNDGGESNTLSARLVVGADGRASMARQWAGFNVAKAPEPMLVAGVLLNTLPTARDTAWFQFNPDIGQLAFWFPQRNGTVRAYVVYQSRQDRRLSNARHVAGFFEESIRCGVTADWFDGVQAIGPLATSEGGNTWVPHPYKDGIALIGDAAASSDPAWGEGMSLTLSDVHNIERSPAAGERLGHRWRCVRLRTRPTFRRRTYDQRLAQRILHRNWTGSRQDAHTGAVPDSRRPDAIPGSIWTRTRDADRRFSQTPIFRQRLETSG